MVSEFQKRTYFQFIFNFIANFEKTRDITIYLFFAVDLLRVRSFLESFYATFGFFIVIDLKFFAFLAISIYFLRYLALTWNFSQPLNAEVWLPLQLQ